jgi:hypothetical protein
LKTFKPNKKDQNLPAGIDHRYMINVVTSMCLSYHQGSLADLVY